MRILSPPASGPFSRTWEGGGLLSLMGKFVEGIQFAIRGQLQKLNLSDHGADKVAERLHKAISEGGRSADVGMAGRMLREFIIAHVLSPADIKKLTPYETVQELRKLLIAEWVIC